MGEQTQTGTRRTETERIEKERTSEEKKQDKDSGLNQNPPNNEGDEDTFNTSQ